MEFFGVLISFVYVVLVLLLAIAAVVVELSEVVVADLSEELEDIVFFFSHH
jgi:uncharacterized metal-binding protein